MIGYAKPGAATKPAAAGTPAPSVVEEVVVVGKPSPAALPAKKKNKKN